MRTAVITTLPRLLWQSLRRRPLIASINLTNRCTEKCPMCSVWRTDLPEMTTPELVSLLEELRRFGIRAVELSGGEPLLRADLGEIVAALDRLGMLYTLTTNGTILPEGTIEILRRSRGLLQVAVSLDSVDPERYALLRGVDALPRVLANLEALRTARLPAPLKLNVTVSRVNYDELPALLAFASDRSLFLSAFPVNVGAGFHHRDASPLFSATPEERRAMAAAFRVLARLRRKGESLWEYSGFYDLAAAYVEGTAPGPCAAGSLYLDVRADGSLAPCVDLPAIGKVAERNLERLWRKMKTECASAIDRCWRESPCCYTCTYNVLLTRRNRFRFLVETCRLLLLRRRGTP